MLGFGLAAAYVLHRLASVRIAADAGGLTVVNIFRRRRLEWPEVLGVRLSAGDPWVQLDLADGTTMAAMGIQGADGSAAWPTPARWPPPWPPGPADPDDLVGPS